MNKNKNIYLFYLFKASCHTNEVQFCETKVIQENPTKCTAATHFSVCHIADNTSQQQQKQETL